MAVVPPLLLVLSRAFHPKIGIISCGKDNRYGHPHSEVLEVMEGRSILRTDQQGMIRFSWSNWHRVQQLETWLDYRLE